MTESLYPHMVQEYYVRRLREVADARAVRLAQVTSTSDVMELREAVRGALRAAFGPVPARTPLRAETTAMVRRKTFAIENVLYESRPGFRVSANLYVPHGEGPFPVVLGPCGHSGEGKACDVYQAFASGLANRGYMVLVYDPVSQGERVQILRRAGSYRPGDCCHEHNLFGNRLALLGEFFGLWRVWDGVRGLDYLLDRPEADASRVGVTGNSGGGTLTTYLSALDDRFTMAAPSCFVTTFLHNIENELPADSEQTPPGILAAGLDFADYFIAQIPRPVILLGQQDDYFDVRGLRQTYRELRRLYALLGAEDDVQLFVGPRGHGYSPESREAMYAFFSRHSGRPADAKPSEARPLSAEKLNATPSGSVVRTGSRTMQALMAERASSAAAGRRSLTGARLREAIRQALVLPNRDGVPHYRVLRTRAQARRRAHSVFAVETEEGIQAVLHLYSREALFHLPECRSAVVVLPHISAEQDAADGLGPHTGHLWALDVRGMGLSRALTCGGGDFMQPYGSDYMYAAHGQMLGEPYLGRRVLDVLRTLDLLASSGCRDVHLIGRGLGALHATFAGCLHGAVTRVTLHDALPSYHDLMAQPVAEWPRSAMAFGLLCEFDLPDCYAELDARGALRLVSTWDHLMRRRRSGPGRKKLPSI